MQVSELVQEVQDDITEQQIGNAKRVLKERLQELDAAKVTVARLQKSYDEFLEKDVSEVGKTMIIGEVNCVSYTPGWVR